MNIDGIVLAFITIGAIVGIFYYAIRILESMRHGNLEKSWKYLSIGAVFAIAAMIVIITIDLGEARLSQPINNFLTSDVSPGLAAIATICFFLGFRAHFLVWNPKGIKASAVLKDDNSEVPDETSFQKAVEKSS